MSYIADNISERLF